MVTLGRIDFGLLFWLLNLGESMSEISMSPFVGGYTQYSLEEDLLNCSSTADSIEKESLVFKGFIAERLREGECRELEASHGYVDKGEGNPERGVARRQK